MVLVVLGSLFALVAQIEPCDPPSYNDVEEIFKDPAPKEDLSKLADDYLKNAISYAQKLGTTEVSKQIAVYEKQLPGTAQKFLEYARSLFNSNRANLDDLHNAVKIALDLTDSGSGERKRILTEFFSGYRDKRLEIYLAQSKYAKEFSEVVAKDPELAISLISESNAQNRFMNDAILSTVSESMAGSDDSAFDRIIHFTGKSRDIVNLRDSARVYRARRHFLQLHWAKTDEERSKLLEPALRSIAQAKLEHKPGQLDGDFGMIQSMLERLFWTDSSKYKKLMSNELSALNELVKIYPHTWLVSLLGDIGNEESIASLESAKSVAVGSALEFITGNFSYKKTDAQGNRVRDPGAIEKIRSRLSKKT